MSRICRDGELDDVLVLLGDAADAGGGVVPPLLLQQEGLVDQVVGPALPRFPAKRRSCGSGSMQASHVPPLIARPTRSA